MYWNHKDGKSASCVNGSKLCGAFKEQHSLLPLWKGLGKHLFWPERCLKNLTSESLKLCLLFWVSTIAVNIHCAFLTLTENEKMSPLQLNMVGLLISKHPHHFGYWTKENLYLKRSIRSYTQCRDIVYPLMYLEVAFQHHLDTAISLLDAKRGKANDSWKIIL